MIRFEDLLEKVRGYSPDADVELLRRAYVFSAFEHRGQVRHSGEPYLIHPLAVADFLADMRLDPVAIAAGLLHDVVEDTLTTIEKIQEHFGSEVAHVVEGVTKISAIPFLSSEERQAENFRKMLLAMVDDIRVILVKLADRLHNMRTLNHLPEDRRIAIAQETRDIYAPIANRIVTGGVKDCYATLGIIHQTWSPVPGRIKDFIAMPRPNGYQSLHTSVISEHGMPFEVQIRTQEMHRMAEEGIAAHWKYKEGRVGDQRDERYFQWMRQLLDMQQEVRDPQEFIQNLKVELYPEEVYTFTPKGLVKALPRGATAIDFAYAIHTDVGHQCVGARVNGKMVPLRTRLKNGDIVEIVTQTGHKPSRDWLNFVATSRARNKIKHLIHAEEKSRATELGRKLFDKEARRYDVNPKTVVEGPAFAAVLSDFGVQKDDDVFAAIGYGKVQPKQVLMKLVPPEKLHEKPPEGAVAAAVKRVLGTGEEKIKVRGFDDLMVFRARCCNPIRGEKIVGYITRGKGVSVHSATCPNVVNLLYDPERRIDVEWDKTETVARYTVKLTMEVEDRKGLLAAVSAKIADINTNIKNMEARTDEGAHARIDATLDISALTPLATAMKSLRGVEGVLGVERAGRAG